MWIDGALTAAPFLLAILCLRVVPNRGAVPSRIEEAAWILAAAGLMVGLGGIWLGTFPLQDSGVITTSDFSEYCRSVAAAADGRHTAWSANRSRLSGLAAILLSPKMGTQDALLVNAWMGTGLLGAGLYLWGRAVHSPLAGVAAVLAACTMPPVVALGRMLTFYPVIVGTLTFATGVVAAACRWPSLRSSVAAGGAIGLALLVDLRGLLWAIPLLGLSGLWLTASAQPRAIPARWAALLLPIVAAWWWAPWAYPPQTTSLEVLAELSKGWQGVVKDWHARPPGPSDGGYTWGRSDISRIPDTVIWLAAQGDRVPEFLRTHPRTLAGLQSYLVPLQNILVGASIVAVAGTLRKPTRLLLMVGTSVPFALALNGAIAARFAGLRFLGNGMPFLAILAGVGFAAAVHGVFRCPREDIPIRLRGAAALFFLFLVVGGHLGTPLSPTADWRGRQNNADAGLLTACELPTGAPSVPTLLYRLP